MRYNDLDLRAKKVHKHKNTESFPPFELRIPEFVLFALESPVTDAFVFSLSPRCLILYAESRTPPSYPRLITIIERREIS